MKILFTTSEISPWVKTGGLGDVSQALPLALQQQGADVRVLIPAYPAIKKAFPQATEIARPHFLGGELPTCSLLYAKADNGLIYYLIDYPPYYNREGNPYINVETNTDWHDNHLRFGLLSRISAWIGSSVSTIDWHPEIIQCNDWQSALTPLYLKIFPNFHKCKTVLTIHNLAFQGLFPKSTLSALAIPEHLWRYDGVEFFDNLSFLKSGIQLCDYVTTVSEKYAEEITTTEFGCGLDKLLQYRKYHLKGIVNGVDENWLPQNDKYLSAPFENFNVDNVISKKKINRRALQKISNINISEELPIIGIISRLTHQKGLDQFAEIADEVLALPIQVVMLGSGDSQLENAFIALGKKHKKNCSITIGFNEALSHQITAGSDLFLMPSRFEPCGLNQMYSQLYGTLPIVRAVGGLADTVINYDEKKANSVKTASGFVFSGDTSAELFATINRACQLSHHKTIWQKLMKNAMRRDFSWDLSAEKYLQVFRGIKG